MGSLISIVIPVYNRGIKVKDCVESIKRQTYKDIELIFVDDKSTDNSISVCKSLNIPGINIQLIESAQNGGPGTARNKGLLVAKGKYVIFLDSDDELKENALSILAEEMEAHDEYDAIIFGYTTRWENSERIVNTFDTPQLLNNSKDIASFLVKWGTDPLAGAPWNKIFRRDFLIKNEILFPEKRQMWAEDYTFILDFFLHNPVVLITDKCLHTYFRSESGLTNYGKNHSTDMNEKKKQVSIILNKYFQLTLPNVSTKCIFWGCYFILNNYRVASHNLKLHDLICFIKECIRDDENYKYIISNYSNIDLNVSQKLRMFLLKNEMYEIFGVIEYLRSRIVKMISRSKK